MSKVRLPFAWLGRYLNWLSLGALLAIAAGFRLYQLTSLPPGLYTGEAHIGLATLKLLEQGALPSFDFTSGYAPLWIFLQAVFVKLLGSTVLGIRLLPALLGIAAVVFTWLWGKEWFGHRIGWLAAFLMAVTPWSVTLSRNAMPTALIMALVPLTLWTATKAYRSGSLTWWLVAATVLVLDLLAGPLGWLTVLVIMGMASWQLIRRHEVWLDKARWAGMAVLVAGLGVMGYIVGMTWQTVRALPEALNVGGTLTTWSDAASRTLLMFNVQGDENVRHNFNSQPMLNAFVGLMFIAGILVCVSRVHVRRYRLLLVLLTVLMLPALLSTAGAPNAAYAVGALPVVMVVAALGINYMLELWYATFPINSAARNLGQAVIVVLLGLTFFHGYTQYFRAWAASGDTHLAYNEAAVAASRYLTETKFQGTRYFIGDDRELPVNAYLSRQNGSHQAMIAKDVAGIPLGAGARQFVITASARDEAAKSLSLKFPGNRLQPRLSSFSQNEIFYVYEVAK